MANSGESKVAKKIMKISENVTKMATLISWYI